MSSAEAPSVLAEAAVASQGGSPPKASLRHRILRGTFWSTAGRIASMGAMLLGNLFLARAWQDSRGEFAAYAVAAAAVVLLGFPATLGAPKILTRIIREGVHTGRRRLLRAQLASANRLMIFSCVAVAVGMIVGIEALRSAGLLSADKWRALTEHPFLLAAWMILASLGMAASQALMGFDDFRSAALVGARNGGVISNLGFILVIGVLWAADRLTLQSALWAQAIMNLLALVAGIQWMRACMSEQCSADDEQEGAPPASESSMRWFFQESWPNLVIQLTSLGIVPVELLLVTSMVGENEIADYTAVQRLQEVLVAGQTLATTIVGPFVSELYVRRDFKRLEQVLRGAATLVSLPALAFCFAYVVFPRQSLAWTFGPEFVGGAWPLRIACIGATVGCLAGPNSMAMIMVGRQRELLRASIVASVIYFMVAPVFIYFFGTVGAAIAVASVFGSYNIVVTIMVKREIGVWTMASLSPQALRAALRKIRGKPL
jgi:O-antigen/teichoic acid export membrane protein